MSQPNGTDANGTDHDTLPPSLDPAAGGGVQEPPTDFWGIVGKLGPGLIIAGSIVGSGELIATTKTGAQAGIALLWLILIGCLIKVFVQIELGRYTIGHGQTTLAALDQVPGPRLGVNWIIWSWLAMMLLGLGQLGGIVGGVGQAAALSFPITGDYRHAVQLPSNAETKRYLKWNDAREGDTADWTALSVTQQERIERGQRSFETRVEELGSEAEQAVAMVRDGGTFIDPTTYDDRIWAGLFAALTAGVLVVGRYRLIQNVSTALVVTFTFVTIGNVISLQMSDDFSIPVADYLHGLSFRLPEAIGDISPLATALATFGIIGVGASELFAYPYWCLEKGYARFAGPRTDSEDWARRARGWMRVMRYDAYASMVIYTIATLAFFVMGVAVLYNEGRDPDGMRMVNTLARAYVPVFGAYAKWIFLIGAIAVLYSTFLVASAGNARMWTDALKVFGLMKKNDQKLHDRSVTIFSVLMPATCFAVFCTGINPVTAILLSGAMQALLLPMIGIGALYFRYTRTDERIRPTLLWDVMLIISCVGLLIAGCWGCYKQVLKLTGGF